MIRRWLARRRYERALVRAASETLSDAARYALLVSARADALVAFRAPHPERVVAHYLVGCSELDRAEFERTIELVDQALVERAELDERRAMASHEGSMAPTRSALHALRAAATTRLERSTEQARIEALEAWAESCRAEGALRELGDADNQLGLALGRAGERERAHRAFDEAVELRASTMGAEAHATLEALYNRATFRSAARSLDEVASDLATVVRVAEARSDRASRELAASAHHNLGALDEERGDLAGARANFERAIAIREQLGGTTDPALRPTLVRLAQLHHREGRTLFALPLYDRALRIAVEIEGPSSPVARAIDAWRAELTEGIGPSAIAR